MCGVGGCAEGGAVHPDSVPVHRCQVQRGSRVGREVLE